MLPAPPAKALEPTLQFHVVAKTRASKHEYETFMLPVGDSVEDAIFDSAERTGVCLSSLAFAIVHEDDKFIARSRWSTTHPRVGSTVYIASMPVGSLGSIFVQLIGIALNFIIPGSGWLITALKFAISVATSLIAAAIAPGPRQRNLGRDDPVLARYTISGIKNQAKPYGTISRVYGKLVNYYPAIATQPYTEIFWGDKQYIRAAFDVSYGPCKISAIAIGDQPIGNLTGTEYDVREGRGNDVNMRLVPEQVREESLNIELKYTGGFVEKRSEPDSDEMTIDITMPDGLQRISDRNEKYGMTIIFEVQIRVVGGSTWGPVVLRAEPGNYVEILGATPIPPVVHLPGSTSTDTHGTDDYIGSLFRLGGNTKSTIRRSISIKFPVRGQYDIRVKRNDFDDRSDTDGKYKSITVERSYWTALRSHRQQKPFTRKGVARIAIRAQATDQLNGQVDQLNCTVESYLQVWDGSVWTEQISRNPAWVYVDILCGSANERPFALTMLDLPALLAWANWCTIEGYTFDGEFGTRSSVWEALQDVCGTACASPTIRDGLFSVVVDNERYVVAQHFTDRNTFNHSIIKSFLKEPHGLKVKFANERTLHQTDELIVYNDGYNAQNATLFESMDLPYTTDARMAWKRGRRALAAGILRTEIHSIETDIEHIACTRGDLIRVSGDVAFWSVGAARVKTIEATTFPTYCTIDNPLVMTGGVNYALTFRVPRVITVDGAPTVTQEYVVPVVTVAGPQTTFTFVAAMTGAPSEIPIAGTLCELHETDKVVYALVRSIEPGNDHKATITYVDYAPAIFTSDTGTIPDHNPLITTVKAANLVSPPIPTILSTNSDEDVLIRTANNALISRIVIKLEVKRARGKAIAEVIQVRFRPKGTVQDWDYGPNAVAPIGEVSLLPVTDLTTYIISYRSITHAGVTSAWAEREHTVIGKSVVGPRPPPNVERLYRSGNLIIWPYPDPPIDIKGFLIRANYGTSQDWNTGTPLHNGVVAGSPYNISRLSGTRTIMVKAVDLTNNVSVTPATLTINLGDPQASNILLTQSEAPTFPGVLAGGTDTGTQIEASATPESLFWDPDVTTNGVLQSPKYWSTTGTDTFWVPTTYQVMTYIATYLPITGHLNDAIARVKVTAVGSYTIDYRLVITATYWSAVGTDLFWASPDTIAFWEGTATEWSIWEDDLGPFSTTTEEVEIRVTTAGGLVKGIVSLFNIIIDVVDIRESFSNVAITVAANGVRLPITKTYRAIKTVTCTRQDDGGTAVDLKIIDKNATTGPLIKAYNSAGAVTTNTFDAVIVGY